MTVRFATDFRAGNVGQINPDLQLSVIGEVALKLEASIGVPGRALANL